MAMLKKLHIAAMRGDAREVERLIAAGSDVDARAITGRTPLHYAAQYGHRDVALLLMEHGARTDLFIAAGLDDVEMAQNLVSDGADVNAYWEWGQGERPLHWSARNNSLGMAQFLLDHGADIDARDMSGETPLMTAAQRGSVEAAEMLISRGASVGLASNRGYTALRLAAVSSLPREVRARTAGLLIAHGAAVDLHIAAALGDIDTATKLLREGANVNGGDCFSVTPLYIAAGYAQVEMVELLIASGADVNARSDELQTPLHAVALADKVDIQDVLQVAQMLIDHGANVNAEHRGCDTPLGFATRNKAVQPELVDLLRAHGARD